MGVLFQKKDSGESQGVTRADLEVALKAIEGKKMSLPQQDNLYLVSNILQASHKYLLLGCLHLTVILSFQNSSNMNQLSIIIPLR